MVLRICGTPSLLASSVLKLTARKGLTLISLSALGLIKWWNDLGAKYTYLIYLLSLLNEMNRRLISHICSYYSLTNWRRNVLAFLS